MKPSVSLWTLRKVRVNHGANPNGKQGLEHSTKGKIVVYRDYFRRLLDYPKPLRDQLLIELPALEALRTGEVASMKHEYFDHANGDLMVVDSKKGELCVIPLHPVVSKHEVEYARIRGITEGFLFSAETKVGRPRKLERGVGISESHINRIWEKWCILCGVPKMSPRYGRAFFACEWMMGSPRKSLKSLQMVLRHDNPYTTDCYFNRIVSYEDVKEEFYLGLTPFVSECQNWACPLRVDGCRCRMFQSLKVKA